MSPYELFDIATATANRADLQWGLFITIHMALFGGIVYVDRPLKRLEKAATLIIYFGFAGINYLMTRNLLEFINLTHREIAKWANDPCCTDNLLIQHSLARIEGPAFEIGMNVLFVSHAVMAVLVVLAVVFDKSLTEFVKQKAK